MAEIQINELNSASNAYSGDYMLIRHGNEDLKIDYNLLAKAIIENYSGSSVGGTTQSLKTALDTVNTNLTPTQITNYTLTENVDTSYSSNVVTIIKMGRIVVINYQLKIISDASSITSNRVINIPNLRQMGSSSMRGFCYKITSSTMDLNSLRYGGVSNSGTTGNVYITDLPGCAGNLMSGFVVFISNT